MNFFRVSVIKDLARIRKDPAAILLSMALPLLIGVLLGFISSKSSGGGPPQAKLLIADHDGSIGSTFLLNGMNQGDLAEMVVTEKVDEAEGRERMDKGEASGLLIIPEKFFEKVFAQEPTELTLITNPSQSILPNILKEALSTFVDLANSLQSLWRYTTPPPIKQLFESEGTPPDELVSTISVTINQLAQRAEPYLFPPVIKVESRYIEEPKQKVSIGSIFFHSMLFLSLIFVAQNLSDEFWKERMAGTLKRTVTTPNRLSGFFLAKLAAGGVVLLVVSVVALAAGKFLFRLPVENVLLGAAWATISGVFMLLLFTMLQISASSQRGASLLTMGLLFPLIMIGGSFFPFEAMPAWMVAVGSKTPNGWALLRFKEILSGTPDFGMLGLTLAGLAGVGVVLFAISLLRLRTFAREA